MIIVVGLGNFIKNIVRMPNFVFNIHTINRKTSFHPTSSVVNIICT
jgi:hypothetical protein